MSQKHYDCSSCQAYCCSYPIIELTGKDCKRLASALKITVDQFKDNYSEREKFEGKKIRIMRQTADRRIGGKSCIFLDKVKRSCTVYKHRPKICRDHPGDDVRCEWFDRMILERLTKGRRVIRLKEMPYTIDGDREEYDSENLPELFDSYVHGDGIWPQE